MNIGSNYQNIYAYANSYSQNTTATQSVSQNSFLAQLEKAQGTNQTSQTQQTQDVEKKDYASMSLEELNNLSYEEYKFYGEEIREVAYSIRLDFEKEYDSYNSHKYSEEDKKIAEIASEIMGKVSYSNYSNDKAVNKALFDEYSSLKTPEQRLDFGLNLSSGVMRSLEGEYINIENGLMGNMQISEGPDGIVIGGYSKEQLTSVFSGENMAKTMEYFSSSKGREASSIASSIFQLWETLLENINNNRKEMLLYKI